LLPLSGHIRRKTAYAMLIEKKSLPNSRIELKISVSAHQFRHAFDAEADAAGKDVKVEGFRPGKAPRAKVIERLGRERIEAMAIDHAISEVYQHTLAEEKIVPVAGPNVNVLSLTVPGPDAAETDVAMEFTAEVDVLPEVKIDGYEKLKVKKQADITVADEDVEKVIDELRQQRSNMIATEADATAKNGMWADISFKGSVDGVAREDMNSDHHPIVIGSGNLIPGFEENIVGMKVGEEKTFKITFPTDYHAEGLAGKEAEFTIAVNELKEVVMAPVDEDFAKTFGQKDLAAMRSAIAGNIREEKEEQAKRELEDSVLDELLKVAKFEVPRSLVEQENERLFAESKERFARMRVDWNQYLMQVGKNEDELKAEMADQAEKNVKIGFALGKVIQSEEIKGADGAAMRQAMDRLIEIATK
jgi:trigger factor